MKQLLLSLTTIAILLTGCSDETIVKDAPAGDGSVIELVTFGLSDNPTQQNKGFCPGHYVYINLETDSVYIQRKIDNSDSTETVAKAGYISGISKHPAIVAYIEASRQYESSNLITPKTPEGTLYCGLTFYTNYSYAGEERIYYFTSRELDKRFELFTDYLLALTESPDLDVVNSLVPDDSIMVPIVNHESFGAGRTVPWSDRPMPPPPVKVNYTPPLEKH
ncbi:hypothetical protein H7F15_09695 [Pontibacter sp. Tf4]|uniref:hypothetical protein n=1 Tax=Pontibacter sp. Tf4 TaxID=2761620 RepID=UPI00162821EB|nr:hypothetical protein [Pontibacter sp. Tf4]MBB6611309.1 hypothetical protein [Pontibacter sp. Tf4]